MAAGDAQIACIWALTAGSTEGNLCGDPQQFSDDLVQLEKSFLALVSELRSDVPFVVKIHADSMRRSRPKLPHFWHFPHGAAPESENLGRDPRQFLHGIVELDESFPTHISVAKIHADSMCRSRIFGI